ncbi:hypothetical protein BO71DRAFT_24350 [Aspergillus ellipticus CBS 707.79]|uniref:Uncharacterized protein n=1 Tax=Aspergillus ellipticus CBS 707.79 TaxID=1448320 RepID=A0A319DX94_9EURO|nr:hypothetical protein BO71DRAFT_24350 [Aspergillus ellipticus CBS 707.79]
MMVVVSAVFIAFVAIPATLPYLTLPYLPTLSPCDATIWWSVISGLCLDVVIHIQGCGRGSVLTVRRGEGTFVVGGVGAVRSSFGWIGLLRRLVSHGETTTRGTDFLLLLGLSRAFFPFGLGLPTTIHVWVRGWRMALVGGGHVLLAGVV